PGYELLQGPVAPGRQLDGLAAAVVDVAVPADQLPRGQAGHDLGNRGPVERHAVAQGALVDVRFLEERVQYRELGRRDGLRDLVVPDQVERLLRPPDQVARMAGQVLGRKVSSFYRSPSSGVDADLTW